MQSGNDLFACSEAQIQLLSESNFRLPKYDQLVLKITRTPFVVIGSQYVDILPDKYYSFLHAGNKRGFVHHAGG